MNTEKGKKGRKANDGRGRLGGRAKGTPNKVTTDLKNWLSDVLDKNREKFEDDLDQLPPDMRIMAMSKLFAFIIPKQAALTVEEQITTEKEALTQWLKDAPAEAIDGIARRVLELQRAAGVAATDSDEDEGE